MSAPEEQAVIDAAKAWVETHPPGLADIFSDELQPLRDAVAALTPPPVREHALTWGQVPAGWEVLAPDGKWYRVEATNRGPVTGKQYITMLGKQWPRDPKAPVTARGSAPAIEALGFPEVLEDGPC